MVSMCSVEEPKEISSEKEFEDYMAKVVGCIMSLLKEQGLVDNYYVFRELGFDIAVFIVRAGLPTVKFLELKVYRGQRRGGVGFGNQRGEGPQVDVLLHDEYLIFFNKFLRWIILDLTILGNKRYMFIDNIIAKESAMGGVERGKQNNFNMSKLRKYAITWQELIRRVQEFMVI